MKRLAFLLAILLAGPATAHEFWISPEQYEVPSGGTLRAEFRVGQDFNGAGYVFVPSQSARFEVVSAAGVTELTPRVGDRPALNTPAPGDGLNVAVEETEDMILTYKEMDLFRRFITHKDWAGLETEHRARGLPEQGFRETYRRYAKSLIAVGDGAGQDHAVGLDIEIVAQTNPYTDDLSEGMVVDVIYNGAPRSDAQVEVFEKAPGGGVVSFKTRTDAEGRARFDVKPAHEYLVDSVVIRSTGNDDVDAGPVWHSLWASLTFRVPG